MRDDLLNIIRAITDGKKSNGIVPSAALYAEISNALHKEVQQELNEMVKDGTLTFHRAINSVSFEIKK